MRVPAPARMPLGSSTFHKTHMLTHRGWVVLSRAPALLLRALCVLRVPRPKSRLPEKAGTPVRKAARRVVRGRTEKAWKVAAASPLAEAQLPPRAQRATFCAAGILFLGDLRGKRGGASTVLKLRARAS
jgi:hypothetical protein